MSVLFWQYSVALANSRLKKSILITLALTIVVICRLLSLSLSEPITISKSVEETPIRRELLDRNGIPLAINLPTASLCAYPHRITQPYDIVAKRLIKALPSLEYHSLLAKLQSNKKFVWLKHNITIKDKANIEQAGILGIEAQKNYRRFYTQGSSLSHVIGYVDLYNNGLAGIERGLNAEICNDRLQEKILLSIDSQLQNIVKEELKLAISTFGAKGANAIIADVNTGEIISFVNEPSFDPYNIDFSNPEALLSKNSIGTYELGSIMKPIIMAIGFDTNTIGLHDVYDVTNLSVSKYKIQDYTQTSGNKSIAQIFAHSSNKGLGKIALEIGQEKIQEYFQKLGLLDAISHVEISEHAKPILPPRSKWSDITLTTVAYGYGISVTPLHYVQAMIPIINGGTKIPLTFLKRTNKISGTKVLQNPLTTEKMKILMSLAATHGSLRAAYIKDLDVGGKTGTANKVVQGKYSKTLRISSVMATFPVHNPKYIVYATLDEPHATAATHGHATGGYTMAPAVKQIIKRMSIKYGIEKQPCSREQWYYLMNPPQNNS
ncbi:peptidoglycan D,D-transpeptidase FtsI family protein [Candidatus Sneabacter namystus]|uniref:Penicillin-binding protein 2 n=1 Tax=Candidatus Sneabacter namystus TaxID=2601646 RepID=A0A5C0ULF2_9RICK|nr:penicillin-binding protein 2 [Candidatus Sneabacter namystus]QEK39704.1 penicillin-binding protein 2 [Candidatus Sneabacter namystus]